MKKVTPLLVSSVLLLSGCAGVKSSFDCDVTTSDTCMTMTKANRLVRDKAAKQAGKPVVGGLPPLVSLPVTSAVEIPSASRSAASSPSGTRAVSTTPPISAGMSAGVDANTTMSTLMPRPAVGTPVTTTLSLVAYRPVVSVVTPTSSCQNVRCDNSGSVYPQRSQDQIATVWIAPWVDSNNAFHQPGRVSFVVSPIDQVLPARVN